MNEPDSEGGWSIGKVLGVVIGLLGMVGFGVCGLVGLTFGLGGLGSSGGARGGAVFLVLLSLCGLGIAVGCFLLVRTLARRAWGEPP